MNSSRNFFVDVAAFQSGVLGRQMPYRPALCSMEQMKREVNCLLEEINELTDSFDKNDIVGVSDALADLVYFAIGIAYKLGIPFDQVWKVVHEANMQKVMGDAGRGYADDAAKPNGWKSPEEKIEEVLRGKA